MDIQQTLVTLLSAVICVAIPIVVKAATDFLRNVTEGTVIEEAIDIVCDAVDETNQTFADQLRKDGTFNEAMQKEALRRSLENSLAKMNDRMKTVIEKHYNDLEKWILTQIEAMCKQNNKEAAATNAAQ
ncbi:hypothetical protein NXH76_12170 [Blautia schinkii]|nr:hypothetical protein [Blautia schinkii]